METNRNSLIKGIKEGELQPLFGMLFDDPKQADYTAKSIETLEELLNEMYPDEKEQRAPEIIASIGMYLGETLRRLVPGLDWKLETNDIWDLKLELDNKEKGLVVMPLVRADKFFKDRTDGLMVWLQGIVAMHYNMIDPEKLESGKWMSMGPNAKFRATQVKKDDLH